MMSGMPLETCSAFNERCNNKFYYKVASCWLFLLSHTTMHGSMNIKLSEILRKLYLILSMVRAGNYITMFIPTTAQVFIETDTAN